MEQVLSGLRWKTLFIYLDDVIVISPDFDTHVSQLREVFDRLRAASLKFKEEYILDTDASNHNAGAVMSQVQDGREVVVAYYSKALSASEKNYCTTRRELLAVVKAIKHFRPYLYGRTFRLRTDHASLKWLCRPAEPFSQVACWLEILAEFSYRIEHRPGKKHGNADGLSRRQADGCKQCLNIKRRDGGPPRSDVEVQMGKAGIYSWEEGQLRSEPSTKAVSNLHANPTLPRNVKELCHL